MWSIFIGEMTDASYQSNRSLSSPHVESGAKDITNSSKRTPAEYLKHSMWSVLKVQSPDRIISFMNAYKI